MAAAALLLFGPQKLPEIGRALGEALGSLKKAYNSAANFEETPSHSSQPGNQINCANSHTVAATLPSTSEVVTSSETAELNSKPDLKI